MIQNAKYSKGRLAFLELGIFWAFLLITIAVLYTGYGVSRVIAVFLFCIVALIVLLPYAVPIINVPLLLIFDNYHEMILNIFGLPADAFTYSFISLVIICYMIIGYLLSIATILSVIFFMTRESMMAKVFNKLSLIKKKQDQ